MKIIYFNVSALAVLAVIILSSVFRKMTKGRANVFFLLTLAEVFITSACGTAAIYLDNAGAGNYIGKWIFHGGYLFFHTLTAAFYLCYLISLTDTWYKLRKNKLLLCGLSLPAVLFIILMIVNTFTKSVFYIGVYSGEYERSTLFAVIYAVAAFYLIFGVYYIFRYRKLFTVKWIITLFAPFPLILASTIAEYFYPHIVIELFVNAMALMFLSNNIQHPDEIIDRVTGLGNATACAVYCRKAFLNKKPVTEILIKITNYKTLREMLSFDEKTYLKKAVASGLVRSCRATKTKADIYYNGDGTYCLLLSDSQAGKQPALIERIREFLGLSLRFGGSEISLSTTVCVIRIPDDISDFDTLMTFNRGFEGLPGKENIVYASDLFCDDYYGAMLNMEKILGEAISKNKLEVYYQPIYSVTDGRFRTCEALVCLRDEKYGIVPPDLFIPAAERNGFIHEIGNFVLNEVCSFISCEEFGKLGIDYIEVNLSAVECIQNNLTQTVIDILDRHGVPRERINLEITETAVLKSPESFISNLRRLTEAGISISLDDFGSGYSNIQRIAQLPVSIVKLDKSFISELNEIKSKTVLGKIIDMLRSLDVKVVIEGVEHESQSEQFSKFGCDYIQGYYFARPMSRAEYVAFLTENNN